MGRTDCLERLLSEVTCYVSSGMICVSLSVSDHWKSTGIQ